MVIDLITFPVWWGVWRRMFGGLGGFNRPALVVLGSVMAYVSFAGVPSITASGVTLDWAGLVAAAISAAFWTPGHEYGQPTASWDFDKIDIGLIKRYGPIGFAWIVMRRVGSIGRSGWSEISELIAGAKFGALMWMVKAVLVLGGFL